MLWTDTALFSHLGIYFKHTMGQPETVPRSGVVRGTRAMGLGWGWSRASSQVRPGLAVPMASLGRAVQSWGAAGVGTDGHGHK